MKTICSFLFGILFSLLLAAQDNPAYVIYSQSGKKVSFKKLEKITRSKKFVFFGEQHNDPIAHWLQFQLLENLIAAHPGKLVVGSEMFERDNQAWILAFQEQRIKEKTFEDSCRLWSNYETDYKPMLEYATKNNVKWIATNIPRKYASMVYKKGLASLDTLPASQKQWICPLPFELDTTLSQYAALSDSEMHMGPNFVRAQAIKDATMAYSIYQSMLVDGYYYHLNGAYHSDYFQGILWYLQKYTGVKSEAILTISTVSQSDITKLSDEHKGKADFIICVPETMTKTH
jgi:uncharacterized iron-regulated protein